MIVRDLVRITSMVLMLSAQGDALKAQTPAAVGSEHAITFLSHRTGSNLLYTMKADGTGIRPIFGGVIKDVPTFTDGVKLVRAPHWTRQSPNGKFFASWVYEESKPYEKYQGASRAMLWVGDVDGKWTRIVDPDCTEEFCVVTGQPSNCNFNSISGP